jgi:hypothetical protein
MPFSLQHFVGGPAKSGVRNAASVANQNLELAGEDHGDGGHQQKQEYPRQSLSGFGFSKIRFRDASISIRFCAVNCLGSAPIFIAWTGYRKTIPFILSILSHLNPFIAIVQHGR